MEISESNSIFPMEVSFEDGQFYVQQDKPTPKALGGLASGSDPEQGGSVFAFGANEMLLILLCLNMRSREQMIISMLFAFRKPCRCLNEENA